MDANDYYQKGLAIIRDPSKFTADGTDEARRLFEKAIELDSQFWRAYAELAYVYVRKAQNGRSEDRAASLEKAEELAKQALHINDGSVVRWSLAMAYWNQGKFKDSFDQYEEARKRTTDPAELADLDADEAEARIYAGDLPTARTKIQLAMSRNPNHPYPYWYDWNDARLCYMEEDYQGAINAIAKIANPPNDVLLITAASKAQQGNDAGAKADMADFRKNDPDWTLAQSAAYPYGQASDLKRWLDGLRQAGLP